jgi:hypothetical protein
LEDPEVEKKVQGFWLSLLCRSKEHNINFKISVQEFSTEP